MADKKRTITNECTTLGTMARFENGTMESHCDFTEEVSEYPCSSQCLRQLIASRFGENERNGVCPDVACTTQKRKFSQHRRPASVFGLKGQHKPAQGRATRQ